MGLSLAMLHVCKVGTFEFPDQGGMGLSIRHNVVTQHITAHAWHTLEVHGQENATACWWLCVYGAA